MHLDHSDPVNTPSLHSRLSIARLRAHEAAETRRVSRNRLGLFAATCLALGVLAALAACTGCGVTLPAKTANALDRFAANDIAITTSRQIAVLTIEPRSTDNDHERALLAAQLRLAERVRAWVAAHREGN